jgi:hypothetical protein
MNGPGSDPRATLREVDGLRARNERIIWIAFLISPVIYAIVGYGVIGSHTMPAKAAALPFYLVGLLVALLGLAAPRLIPRSEPTGVELVAPARIVSWAIDEAVSIVGLVGVFLGAFPLATFALFALASMGLIWLHRPGD